MKKSLIMLTALMAVASLSGCGNKGNSSSSSPVTSGSGSTTSGATTSATPTTSAGPTTSSTTQQRSLVSISAVYNGDAIDYGGAINKDDVEVTAHYSDSTEEPVEDFTLDYNSQTPNPEMEVTVTFSGKTTTFTVTINKVALSLTASYVGGELKYGSTITKSKVEVLVNYSDGSQSEKLGTTKYDISYNTQRKAGDYTDGVVTGKSEYAGLNTNFSFTIARDHLPSGCEDIEAEISRMVIVMNPTVIDPEYHIDFEFNSSKVNAYFIVSGYQTEKTDLFEIANEIALTLDSNATVSNVPYLDDNGGAYSEYFLTSVGLEMFVYNAVVQGVNMAQIGVFHSSKVCIWATERIAALVHSLDETTTTVIPEVTNLFALSFNESYAQYGIHGLTVYLAKDSDGEYHDPTASYVSGLVAAGWNIKESGTQFSDTTHTCVSPDKKIVMELGYNDNAKTFIILFYANTLGFPFDEMKAVMTALESTNDPVAPASSDFFMFYTSSNYWKSHGLYEVYTFGNDAAAIQTSFEEAWVAAGWTLVNMFSYWFYQTAAVSPDGKVCIEYGLYGDYFDMFYCAFDEYIGWNVEAVAEVVSNLVPVTSTTVVPEFTNSNHFKFDYNSIYNVGFIYCETADSASAISAYVSVLEGASWVESDPTSSGDRVFISPNSDLQMTIVGYTNYVYLQLESYSVPAAEWPSDALAALTPSGIRDSIPAYAGEEVSSYQVNTTGINPAVFMYSSDSTVTVPGYAAACELEGYVNDAEYAEEIGIDYFLISPNEDIYIYVYHNDSEGIVTAEIEFNPVLSLDELSTFLTAFGYPTDQLETYYNLIKDSEPRATYSSSGGYQYMYFYISDTLLDATKTWCESMGLSLHASTETRIIYGDTVGHEIDIYVMGDGTLRVVIWED